MLITSDTYSKFISKKDAGTRILFGDGATSTLISNKKNNGFEINNFVYGTDGSGFQNAIIHNFGSRYWKNKLTKGDNLNLDGPGIYEFALKRVPEAVNVFLEK